MKKMRQQLEGILLNSMNERGLPVASSSEIHNKCWTRDTYYILHTFLKTNPDLYVQGWESYCEYFNGLDEKYSDKVQHLIKGGQSKVNKIEFIHPCFNPDTLEEISGEWGNVQIDSLAYPLLAFAEAHKNGLMIKGSYSVMVDTVRILKSIKYWECEDQGIWEEDTQKHASSIGAVVSALKAITPHIVSRDREIVFNLIEQGENALKNLLPKESVTKENDLALATISCFPFKSVSDDMSKQIVQSIHSNLEGFYGAIRYKGDTYKGHLEHSDGEEMMWPMWFGFAGIYYANNGMRTTAQKYLERMICLHHQNGQKGLPEGYVGGEINPNNPLGWSVALMIILIDLLNDKE